MKYSFDFMYEKTRDNDSSFNGLFFTCVKTTKIFCLPSCKARLPLKKNVEFVFSSNEAIKKGYIPCKRCHPVNDPNFNPEWVEAVKAYLIANFNRRIPDPELTNLVDLDISTIRRYFKDQYGMSIKEYHRTIRLNKALELLSTGLKISEVSSLVGYLSIKGFKQAYKSQYGEIDNE
jgi:AraC family transcriptional regulator of adaptative response/methylated-DNA-[protein]-cysteine methyltransferase